MTAVAKRDVLRLKFNWLFLVLASTVRAINYTCVIPTNHQFIINPTTKTLNITNEVTYVKVTLLIGAWFEWIMSLPHQCVCTQKVIHYSTPLSQLISWQCMG